MKQIKSSLLWAALIVFISATILLTSCQKEEQLTTTTTTENAITENLFSRDGSDSIPYVEGSMTVISKGKNPYSVTNMKNAWDYLASNGVNTTISGAQVKTTHYYVKFKPKDADQYEQLHSDTTLDFADYPIESNVLQNGDYYHDPSLPDSVPTYQYTAVKTNYQFPNYIAYEIIDNLYIPETDELFQYENGGTQDLYVDKLLNRAYTQTGNYEDTIDLANYSEIYGRRYTPDGRIRVFDTRLANWIGMEGVRVQARRWFIIYKGYPDFNGNYRMNHSYKRPCNYSIWFASDRFSIRQNLVNTTYWINGPKQKGDWNYDLNQNGYQQFAGHIFRGAFRYHQKDIGGLQRPNRWLNRRTVYIAKNSSGDNSGVNWIVFPVIKIWRYTGKNVEYKSDEIFSTTCHETAHTSHVITMNAGPIQYWQVTRQIQESWPVAVEWFLSHIEYNDRGVANYGEWNYHPSNPPQYPNDRAYQYWSSSTSSTYTTLFINLVDNVNESTLYFGTPNDQVSGYTLADIENRILKHCYGLSSLGTQLKSIRPVGITDAQIDLLLSFY